MNAFRTHSDIVRAFGATALASALRDLGFDLHWSAPGKWAERNSIPGEYWHALERIGAAQLDELAASAEVAKFPNLGSAA